MSLKLCAFVYMIKMAILGILFVILVSGCASLLGVDPDYLQQRSIHGIYNDKLERKAGFDRIFVLRIKITDHSKTFGRDTLINSHFDRTEAPSAPSSGNTVYPDGEWSMREDAHYYLGRAIAQAKNDSLRLDLITIGKV